MGVDPPRSCRNAGHTLRPEGPARAEGFGIMSEIVEPFLKVRPEVDTARSRTDVSPPSGGIPPRLTPSVVSREDALAATPAASRRRHRLRALLTRGGNGHGQEPDLVISPEDQTQLAEQFRVLRTHIEVLGPCSLMVASSLDREGKTLCAVNLAVTLSLRIGSGVILVDADLRHSCVGAYLGVTGRHGLVEYLLAEAGLDECLLSTRYKDLWLLPAGRHTSMAPELLGSERLHALITDLRARFPNHFIVFDGPPLLLTSDPMVIARHIDRVVLVVRAGVTPRAAVVKAVQAIGPDKFLGVVLNAASESVSDYYYYGRRYGYYRPPDSSTRNR